MNPARTLRLVFTEPRLAAVFLAVILNGTVAASLGPFTSLLAIEVFGLTDHAFSVVLAIGSVVAISGSVTVGIVTDQRANRRRVAIATSAMLAGAGLLVLAGNSAIAFALAHALILPAGRTINSQLFALARLAASGHPPAARDGVTSTIRTGFALPFVVILPLWAAAFSHGLDLRAVYAVPLVAGTLTSVLLWAVWPRDGHTPWEDRPSGLTFAAALRELTRFNLMGRVALTGVLVSGSYTNLISMGLIFAETRGPADVALFSAIVALIEMPAMLSAPMLSARFGRNRTIAGAAILFAVFFASFPFVVPTPWVWLWVVPFAVAQGVTLSIPIAYLQDLVGHRPGAGASLIALQGVVTQTTGAAVFAIATAIAGYWLTDILSAALILAAAAIFWRIDVQR